jgi:hypothetical protein
MAVNLTDHQYCDGLRTGGGFGQRESTVVIKEEWPAASLSINSQFRVFKANRACFVKNFVLATDQLDTHATPTLTIDVGTNTDDDEFIAASAVGQTGGTEATNTASSGTATEPAGFPLAAGEYVIISIKAAAATAAAGTVKLWFDVMDADVD